MAINKKLTDKTEKLIPPSDFWMHIVDINDVTDSPEGSDFKIKGDNLLKGYRAKKEKAQVIISDNNSIEWVVLQSNASYRFIDSIATIKGIVVNTALNNSGLLYDGKEFTFSNYQTSNITLLSNASLVDLPFSFPNNANVILLPGEILKVKFSEYSGKLELISKNDWLSGNVRLLNYPSTRNDGQLPNNKVLSTDINGNLKMYTIATSPPPFLQVLIPNSTLPSTTTDFILKGSFYTPTMTVAIVGQTINYLTFISDNEVRVNVTTGATEGMFAVTLNNGVSATFPNALLIILGVVFQPIQSEWEAPTGNVSVAGNDSVKVVNYETVGSNRWSKLFDNTKNYRVNFKFTKTPLGSEPNDEYDYYQIVLVKASDNIPLFQLNMYRETGRFRAGIDVYTPISGGVGAIKVFFGSSFSDALDQACFPVFSFRYLAGVMYLYIDQTLIYTFAQTVSVPLKLMVKTKSIDITNIKYIELAQ